MAFKNKKSTSSSHYVKPDKGTREIKDYIPIVDPVVKDMRDLTLHSTRLNKIKSALSTVPFLHVEAKKCLLDGVVVNFMSCFTGGDPTPLDKNVVFTQKDVRRFDFWFDLRDNNICHNLCDLASAEVCHSLADQTVNGIGWEVDVYSGLLITDLTHLIDVAIEHVRTESDKEKVKIKQMNLTLGTNHLVFSTERFAPDVQRRKV